MKTVFVLQHVHLLPAGQEDIKLIGVYSSSKTAQAAIERVRGQPGFREHPQIIDPVTDDDESGFYIEQYELDKDHWLEGFVTV